jgi:hypothetical protein
MPVSAWPTPSVAMNGSTCSFTTMKPDTTPACAAATTAISAATGAGKRACCDR